MLNWTKSVKIKELVLFEKGWHLQNEAILIEGSEKKIE